MHAHFVIVIVKEARLETGTLTQKITVLYIAKEKIGIFKGKAVLT